MTARMLPAILFGPFAGALVDRFDRKKIMIAADIARGALYATMAFVHQLGLIFLLSFVIECFSLLWTPARDASLPNLVPRRQLANANSIGLVSTYATLPLGGAVFAVLALISSGARLRAARDAGALAGRGHVRVLGRDGERRAVRRRRHRAGPERFDLSRIWRDVARRAAVPPRGLDRVGDDRRDRDRVRRRGRGAGARPDLREHDAACEGRRAGASWSSRSASAWRSGWRGRTRSRSSSSAGLVFTRSLLSAAAALFLLAAMPTFSLAAVVTVWLGLFCGLAWVSGYTLLQENVEDEYRGRTFASLTVLSRLGLFASLTFFPILSSAYDAAVPLPSPAAVRPLRNARRALGWPGVLVLIAGLNTRRLLGRFRLSRPQPLALVPKLKRPPATGLFIAFEGVEGAGKGTQIRMAEEYLRSLGLDVLVTREPGGTRARRADPPGAARPEDGQARRARRGAAVRGEPRADGHVDHPPGARRREDRPLGPLRRLVARVPGVGARPGRAGRAHAERVGDAGPVPGPRDPAARGARAGVAPVDGGARTGWRWRGRTSTRRSPTPT